MRPAGDEDTDTGPGGEPVRNRVEFDADRAGIPESVVSRRNPSMTLTDRPLESTWLTRTNKSWYGLLLECDSSITGVPTTYRSAASGSPVKLSTSARSASRVSLR